MVMRKNNTYLTTANSLDSTKLRGKGFTLSAKQAGDAIQISAIAVFFDPKSEARKGKLYINVNNKDYGDKKLSLRHKIPFIIQRVKVRIPHKDFMDANIHNVITLKYVDDSGYEASKPIHYFVSSRVLGIGHSRAMYIDETVGTTMYYRQSLGNVAFITVRRTVKSDFKKYNQKINFAFYISRLLVWKKVILLYEKESEKYEESASIVYEKLQDLNYKNSYFVLDPDSKHWSFVPDKYRAHVLSKHSFKHYIYFFLTITFIGTEAPTNAIDSRVANRHANNKLYRSRIKYIFLQHGVMYMVSLGSTVRKAFHKGKLGRLVPIKTIVSSEEEADHFINYAGYDKKDLAITGLPKFDKSIRLKTADKITIMPTWRPWEYNQIRYQPESTRYYKMLVEIIGAIPEELKEKIHLLPHPLVIRELEKTNLKDYIKDFDSYDHVLQKTDVLITDYSSVAYDAFYRGSNVIFWWKEKDYCMEQYDGWLMLNDNNVFGDVVMNKAELRRSIKDNFNAKQPDKYKRRYKKIVAFRDGKNTERLIELLQESKVI